MQINNEFAPVVKSSTTMETEQASVAMTAHMFQILSSGIYQHKERAVIRELSCNANDSHVEAGCPERPFDVHLPTQLEPYFEVRDYGTGMTHEQVMKLYLTYGASTKRDSNDLIGGLGIGSKSPFAIAQSFTVTSYKDGTVRRYSVYMEEGIPQITKLTESSTTEENGVSVRVAVQGDKIGNFYTEACRIYTHFPVQPNCNKPLEGLYDHMNILSEEPSAFRVFSGGSRHSQMTTSIVMGNIEYPIKMSDVSDDIDSLIPQFLRDTISHVLIYLPIGSVNIAASRESLSLTDSTKLAIIEVYEKVTKQILTGLQSKIDNAKNLAEAIKAFTEAAGRLRDNLDLMRQINFQGKSLYDWMIEQQESRTEIVTDPVDGSIMYDRYNRPMKKPKYEPVISCNIHRVLNHSERAIERVLENDYSTFSMFNDMTPQSLENGVLFVLDDRRQKGNGAVKTVGRTAILRGICEKFLEDTSHKGSNRIFIFHSQAEIDLLARVHHYPKDLLRIYKTSDFEHCYTPRKAVKGQVKLWKAEKGDFSELRSDLSEYDEPEYYFKAEGNALVSEEIVCRHDLPEFAKFITNFVPTGRVFMFRKTVWDKIPEDWIEITLEGIEKYISQHPELYIELNRVEAVSAGGTNHTFDRMNVYINMTMLNKKIMTGYIHTPETGLNFEDNMEVLSKVFGRLPLTFANRLYPQLRGTNSKLVRLQGGFLPNDCSLANKIKAARKRAQKNCERNRDKFNAKNPLINWVDFSRVSLREVLEHMGYELTPYVDKQ